MSIVDGRLKKDDDEFLEEIFNPETRRIHIARLEGMRWRYRAFSFGEGFLVAILVILLAALKPDPDGTDRFSLLFILVVAVYSGFKFVSNVAEAVRVDAKYKLARVVDRLAESGLITRAPE